MREDTVSTMEKREEEGEIGSGREKGERENVGE